MNQAAMFTRYRRLLGSLSLISLLNACATHQPLEPQTYNAHLSSLAAIDHWRIKGKIGLRQNGRGGSAALQWEQRGTTYAVNLHGPLGMGSVYIDGDEHKVVVRDQHGSHSSVSPEALIAQMTGWQIPVTPLRYWAKGMPAPNIAIDQQQITDGRLATLHQAGWTIQYSNYARVSNVWLPGKIVMSRPQTRVTFIQKQWQLL